MKAILWLGVITARGTVLGRVRKVENSCLRVNFQSLEASSVSPFCWAASQKRILLPTGQWKATTALSPSCHVLPCGLCHCCWNCESSDMYWKLKIQPWQGAHFSWTKELPRKFSNQPQVAFSPTPDIWNLKAETRDLERPFHSCLFLESRLIYKFSFLFYFFKPVQEFYNDVGGRLHQLNSHSCLGHPSATSLV